MIFQSCNIFPYSPQLQEREKRRRRVLVEQLAAHEAIEQAKHEDMLVTCLMRQSQLERRIALQLLQVRLEKDVIRNNRLQREQQYMQRRLKDFDEALNLEAEVARLTQQEYEEQCEKELARHEAIAAENQHAKYMKHYKMCKDVSSYGDRVKFHEFSPFETAIQITILILSRRKKMYRYS